MQTVNPQGRVPVLFAASAPLGPDRERSLARLLAVLPEVGLAPSLLHRWSGVGRQHVDRRDTVGYPVYRSDWPEADIATLVLMDRPAAVVLVGREALSLASALVAARIPVLLWGAGDLPMDLGALEQNPFLGFAAPSLPEAERLARLQTAPVAALPLPPPETHPYRGGGTEILIVSPHRGDGASMALALAAALPDYSFVFPSSEPSGAWYHGLIARLANVRGVQGDAFLPALRLALFPHCGWVPPWEALAGLMRAQVPLLVGDAPLLVAGVGAAGQSLPLTAPLATWQAAIAALMDDGPARAAAEAACLAQAEYLSPSGASVARLWRSAIDEHMARCKFQTTGRI